jgi:hypothetical protein
MNVGDTVFQNYAGLHRYGKVVEVKENFKGDGWLWVKVNWVNDEQYIKSQRWKAEMRGEEKNHFIPDYYRADDIQNIDVSKTFKTLSILKNSAE